MSPEERRLWLKVQELERRLNALRSPVITTAALTVSTQNTSYQNVNPATGPGLSAQVGIGAYVVEANLEYVEAVTDAANKPRFQFAAPSFSTASLQGWWQENNVSATLGGASGTGPVAGPAFGSNTWHLRLRLKIVTTAAGTIQLQANTSLAADTYSIQPGADLTVAS
jgi:hypothetical protein